MRLTWSTNSEASLAAIWEYYTQFSEETADEVIQRIISRCEDLLKLPWQGIVRPRVDAEEIRYIIVDYYRVTFSIFADEIQILTVFDWRQNPASEGWSE